MRLTQHSIKIVLCLQFITSELAAAIYITFSILTLLHFEVMVFNPYLGKIKTVCRILRINDAKRCTFLSMASPPHQPGEGHWARGKPLVLFLLRTQMGLHAADLLPLHQYIHQYFGHVLGILASPTGQYIFMCLNDRYTAPKFELFIIYYAT